MKNKNFLTGNNNYNEQQNYSKNGQMELNNSNISKPKDKIKNFNNINIINKPNNNFKINKNNENNFSKILKILDEEAKNSNKYKSEINSLKSSISNKNNEIKILNDKIKSLNQNLEKIKQENYNLYQINNIFYKSVVENMNNLKQNNNNINNMTFVNYLSAEGIKKGNDAVLSMIKLLIAIIKDLSKNNSNNISKYNQIKNKIISVNESFEENNKEKNLEINLLQKKNNKLKNILEQNMGYLKQIKEENIILKKRNLKLEKNINILSVSSNNLRKKYYKPIRINYSNNSNIKNDESLYDINNNNMSISTNIMNKTSTDILMDAFHEKENKMKSLHNAANKIYSYGYKNNK